MASSNEIKNRSLIKKVILFIFNIFGYDIKRKNNFLDRKYNYIAEINKEEKKTIEDFQKISLVSELNLWSINQSLRYIHNENIEGDVVECGVYNGSTLSYIGNIINKRNLKKKIWGYDTFSGFVDKRYTEYDKDFKTNKLVDNKENENNYFTLDEVKKNIKKNDKKDFDKYLFIKGDIIETLRIEENLPKRICFLRLDTDLYTTTKIQLEILYPRLEKGGILHIDDYGLCPGVRKAVDEFFLGSNIWLHRVDITCRYLIKK